MAATVWRGRLAFGMVAIPVRLHKAARRARIRFHNVYRPSAAAPPPEIPEPEPPPIRRGSVRQFPPPAVEALPLRGEEPTRPEPEIARVRQAPVTEPGGSEIPKPEILKGYELDRDRYVVVNPAELAALRPRTSSDLEIGEFVRLEEIDPIFFDASYYVVPDPGGEKPYSLLFSALADSRYVALGSLAMHGRENAVVLRPGPRGLILHTLFFEAETNRDEEYAADPALVSPKELEMARMLVQALAAPFDPSKLKDALEERIRQLVQSRAASALNAASREPAPRAAPVIDFLEALRKSLEAARKPPSSEGSASPTRPARKRQRR